MNENKNEGKVKILEMLSEGKIGVDEAMELLKQFPDEKEKKVRIFSAGEEIDPRQINPNKQEDNLEDRVIEMDFSGLSNLGQSIKKTVARAMESLEDLDINIDFDFDLGGSRHRSTMTYISDPIQGSIDTLKLIGKNSSVKVDGYSGNELRITCTYSSKRPDVQVLVNEENGVYELLYDYNAVRSMQIYCEVPHAYIENLHAESKNSSVELNNVKGRFFNLITKNSSIKIDNVECDEITARTKNSGISAEKLAAGHIDFETTNSKIDLEGVTAETVRITTTNGKVVTEYVDAKQLFVKTTNSGIKMENIFRSPAQGGNWETERIIEAHTTNGGVTIYVPREIAAMVQASTSNGRVDCECQNMLMGEISKNYINGRSQNYESSPMKAKINISTTNSAIKIKEA